MASPDDMLAAAQNLVRAVNALNITLQAVFPVSGATSASATAGGGTLPATPEEFLTVTLPDGTARKIPLYLP